VAFDCFLRIGEFTSLIKEDVAVLKDTGVVLRLATTKTGPEQSVVVEDAVVAGLLCDHVRTLPPTSRVFRFSAAQYRKVFKRTCADLGLSGDFVPHSLRHGGATRMYIRGAPVENVMHRGRWRSTKSARHYIQAGRALMVRNKMPERVVRIGEIVRQDLRGSMEGARTLSQLHLMGVGGKRVDPSFSRAHTQVNLRSRNTPVTFSRHANVVHIPSTRTRR
jgi:hypothetical protein